MVNDTAKSEVITKGNMAPEDYEVAKKLCETDPEFLTLWDEHKKLKEKLRDLHEKKSLSDQDQVEIKKLKTKKLRGKDRIAVKIRQHKVASPG